MQNIQYYKNKILKFGLNEMADKTRLDKSTLKKMTKEFHPKHFKETLIVVAWALNEDYYKFVTSFVPEYRNQELVKEQKIVGHITRLFENIMNDSNRINLHKSIENLFIDWFDQSRVINANKFYGKMANNIKNLGRLEAIFNYFIVMIVHDLSYKNKIAFYLSLQSLAIRYDILVDSFELTDEEIELSIPL